MIASGAFIAATEAAWDGSAESPRTPRSRVTLGHGRGTLRNRRNVEKPGLLAGTVDAVELKTRGPAKGVRVRVSEGPRRSVIEEEANHGSCPSPRSAAWVGRRSPRQQRPRCLPTRKPAIRRGAEVGGPRPAPPRVSDQPCHGPDEPCAAGAGGVLRYPCHPLDARREVLSCCPGLLSCLVSPRSPTLRRSVQRGDLLMMKSLVWLLDRDADNRALGLEALLDAGFCVVAFDRPSELLLRAGRRRAPGQPWSSTHGRRARSRRRSTRSSHARAWC